MQCFECNGEYVKIKQGYKPCVDTKIDLVVLDIEVLHCPNCGDECLDDENNNKIDKAIEEYILKK